MDNVFHGFHGNEDLCQEGFYDIDIHVVDIDDGLRGDLLVCSF